MNVSLEGEGIDAVRIGGAGYWSVGLAARHLQVGEQQVRRLLRSGRIGGMRVGGLWMALTSDVQSYGSARGKWRPGGVIGGKPALARAQARAGATVRGEGSSGVSGA